jgi:hypothetical protein
VQEDPEHGDFFGLAFYFYAAAFCLHKTIHEEQAYVCAFAGMGVKAA